MALCVLSYRDSLDPLASSLVQENEKLKSEVCEEE